MKIAKKLPTHIDGHNHIHMIPEVAEIIAEIMTCNWGIYKIRIPDEIFEVSKAEFEGKQKLFIENVKKNIKNSVFLK